MAIDPATFTQGMNTMINNTSDFIAFGKANVEAITAFGKIWAAGMQDLTKQFAGSAMASYEESLALAKALSATKSVKEAIVLQNAYVKASLARAVAESKSLAETSVKLTEQAIAPLTARVDVAADSLKKAA
jgi:phasin family protein